MKRKTNLFLSLLIPMFLSGCYLPLEENLKTSSEICSYMNRNYEGTFTVLKDKYVRTNTEFGRITTLNCHLGNNNYKIETSEYTYFCEWWPRPTLRTNYYPVVYEDQINENIQNWVENRTCHVLEPEDITVKILDAEKQSFSDGCKDFPRFWNDKKGYLSYYWFVKEDLPDTSNMTRNELLKFKSYQALRFMEEWKNDVTFPFSAYIIQVSPDIYDEVSAIRSTAELYKYENKYKGKISRIHSFTPEN